MKEKKYCGRFYATVKPLGPSYNHIFQDSGLWVLTRNHAVFGLEAEGKCLTLAIKLI